MSGVKRRRSPSIDKPLKASKYGATSSDVPDEQEDLASILEQIRQHEASEALVQKLQQEHDILQTTEVLDLTQDDDVLAPASTGVWSSGPTHEDDEAMARRLAREWETLDAVETASKGPTELSKNENDNHSISSQSRPIPRVSSNSGSSTPGSMVDPVNPEIDLLKHRDLFTQSRECTKCGKAVKSPRNLVVFSTTILSPTLLALLHAVCDACGQSHCRGCFQARACAKNCKGKRCDVANCCAKVRAIGLFEALGGFDRQYIGERLNSSNGKAKASKSRSKVGTVGPGGTGYSTGSSTGQYSQNKVDHSQLEDQRAANASKAVAAKWDDIIFRVLETITCLLPSPYSDAAEPYDLLPHPSIRSLISISYLPELLGGLLINDSVTDWTDRSDVYNSMLRLLRRMADSELSVGVLIGERWEKRWSAGLEDWMWEDGSIEWETRSDSKNISRAPPLYDYFKKLTRQCETFLAGASHLLEDGGDGDVEDMTVRATSLCGDFISAQQDMQRALAVITRGGFSTKDPGPKEKGKSRDPNVEMEKNYCLSCEELAFKHISLSSSSSTDGLSYPTFFYAQDVKQTANSTRQPSKRLHLVKEISSMSTSLPPGVWMRADDVRNDVIKIMIAGPEGTPYAGGLFEFHCFLPLDYPTVCPKMNLCTTAGGRVSFNPNLYASGKVCLSLLGTWPGRPEEQWSSKSTLLQVLVSIQSMILVDAPYFNEPGYGKAKLSDSRSIAYNKNIALQTVRWAMVDWMKEEHRSGIWADVIASHFSIRRKNIREWYVFRLAWDAESLSGRHSPSIRKWAQNDDRFESYHSSSTSTAGTDVTGYAANPYHMYNPAYGQGNPPPEPQGLNLLDEFDKGCTLISAW